MKTLDIGSHRFTEVVVLDEPGEGNACHEYEVRPIPSKGATIAEGDQFAKVKFQKGPVGECGVNGCHQEDLLVIVIDRLESFQSGDFACRENQKALDHILEAMWWLNYRTNKRQKRGVEGTNQK